MELKRLDGTVIAEGEKLCDLCQSHKADLQGANLQGADLQGANLWKADLRGANLQRANLRGADIRGADIRGANLDFSAWPLSCFSFSVKADRRLFSQLIAHACRLEVDDPDCVALRKELIQRGIADWFCKYRLDVLRLDDIVTVEE